jgi:hypothetical protein
MPEMVNVVAVPPSIKTKARLAKIVHPRRVGTSRYHFTQVGVRIKRTTPKTIKAPYTMKTPAGKPHSTGW